MSLSDSSETNKWFRDFQADFLSSFDQSQKSTIDDLLDVSTAQLHQDLFALCTSGFAKSGYFVEVGACDGKRLSNTYFLENLGWRGILSEPARVWREDLEANRSAIVDLRAVWSSSGETLMFKETDPPTLSTLSGSNPEDMHALARKDSLDYPVSTVSLNDLLDEYRAPSFIDFLSIDTEGSEVEILKSFDFSHYRFRFVTVEHNYTESRGEIQALMEGQGYTRIVAFDTLFDDWYVWLS